MHDTTEPLSESAGAAWRQQALRVVRRAPEAAMSMMPLGAVELLPERTFAQHGVLGDPQVLVVAFAVHNRGADVAPLADVAVSFAVPAAAFDALDRVQAGWQDGFGWSFVTSRVGDVAQITLHSSELLRDGASTGATFWVRVQPGADVSAPLLLHATGHAEAPHRPAAPSSLQVPVERLEF
jgi:hypothetical protein